MYMTSEVGKLCAAVASEKYGGSLVPRVVNSMARYRRARGVGNTCKFGGSL